VTADFELDRFEWTAPDRLEVSGRWFGVRGRRFVRPTLDVEGAGDQRRLLAVLDHKPWAAEDGQPWIAAFRWEGGEVELSGAELAVAPDIAVALASPDRATVPAGEPRFERDDTPPPADPGPAANPLAEAMDTVDKAFRDLRALETERDKAARERDTAVRERDTALAERDRARSDRTAARRDASTFKAELETVRHDLDAVRTQRDRALREFAAMRDERDAALRNATEVTSLRAKVAESEALRDELSTLRAELDTARTEAAEAKVLRADLEAARADLDAARAAAGDSAEVEALRAEASALRADLAAARAEAGAGEDVAALHAEIAALRETAGEAEALRAEVETLRAAPREDGQAEALRSQLDAVRRERNALLSARDAAWSAQAGAERERDLARAERDAAVAERDALQRAQPDEVPAPAPDTAQLDALNEQIEALRTQRDAAIKERDDAVRARIAGETKTPVPPPEQGPAQNPRARRVALAARRSPRTPDEPVHARASQIELLLAKVLATGAVLFGIVLVVLVMRAIL